MKFKIPNSKSIHIKNILLDYNGTIAIDGKLIEGVSKLINQHSNNITFHIITADTHGTVEKELNGINCTLINLSQGDASSKIEYLEHIGKNETIAIGNGFNDQFVLKQAIIGIAILQDEGLSIQSLISADILCKSIFDAFAYIEKPNRLIATLRP